MRPRILFLYTELGGYNFACMKYLADSGADVHVVHFPVNKEAPFKFTGGPGLTLYVNTGFRREELLEKVRQMNPDLIVCSGWVNKDYIFVCKQMKGRAVLTLAMDNQWRATFRQYIGMLASPFSFLKIFDKVWVPGKRQVSYARKMGFKPEKIYTGFYCCDVDLYNRYFDSTFPEKRNPYPKRFLYVGRYYDYKGTGDLWEAFEKLQEEEPSEWELWCVGAGDLAPRIHPKIKHFGFIQPEGMRDVIRETGVFVMPSRFDQWGVALQEFSIAGFPLVCSDRVGASDTFVKPGLNGFSFAGEDIAGLKEALKRMTKLDAETLQKMGEVSHETGLSITPDTWISTVRNLMRRDHTTG